MAKPSTVDMESEQQEHSRENVIDTTSNTPSSEPPRSKPSLIILTTTLCVGIFLLSLDRTIIAVAIPPITNTFNSLPSLGLYISSYLTTTLALQPLFGQLFTHFPTRPTYLLSFAIFEAGSLLCALAPTSPALIAGRAIAGCGAGGILAGSYVIVAENVPMRIRPLYLAGVSAMYSIGAIVAPLVGAGLTEGVGWRWCFWINLPVGVPVMVMLGLLFRPSGRVERRQVERIAVLQRVAKLDVLGAVLLLGAGAMFFYALERVADGERWGSKLVIGLLVGAGMTVSLFAGWQVVAGESASMMPRLLKQRTVLAAGIANVAMYWTLVTYIYFLVLYFQAIMGASVIDSAVNMLPLVVTCSVFSILAGVLVTSTGYFTPPAIAGTSLTLIGAGLLTTLGEHTITVTWAGFQILVGVGLGLSLQQGIFSMQVVLNAADIPAGTSLQTLCQSLGGAIAVSVGNVLLASTFHSHERQLREAGVDANEVLRSGATAFRSRVSGHDLDVLLNMYAEGLRNTFVTSAAVAGVALIATCLMEMRKAAETTAASSSRSEERKDTVGD